MDYFGLTLSIVLPWFAGIVISRLLFPPISRRNWPLILGYGYFIGIIVITIYLRLWDAVGLHLDFYPIALSFLIICLTLFSVLKHQQVLLFHKDKSSSVSRVTSIPVKIIILTFLSVLIFRYAAIAIDILNIPLFPWDAWVNWAPKAKVWFFTEQLTPFISPEDWLVKYNHNAYTIGTWRYPNTVPLIQLWTLLGIGTWDISIMNIQWLFSTLSLGLAFYGQLRLIHAPRITSTIATYLLLSIPLISVHTVLAGYADIWLASFFTLGAMCLMNYRRIGRTSTIFLVLLFAIACLLTKRPGVIFAFLLIIHLISLFYKVWFVKFISYSAIITMIAITIGHFIYYSYSDNSPMPLEISLPFFGHIALDLYPVFYPLISSLFLFSSWNIFWYSLIVFILFHKHFKLKFNVPAQSILITSSLGLIFIFVFTQYSEYLIIQTTFSRAILYILPLTMYWITAVIVHSND